MNVTKMRKQIHRAQSAPPKTKKPVPTTPWEWDYTSFVEACWATMVN